MFRSATLAASSTGLFQLIRRKLAFLTSFAPMSTALPEKSIDIDVIVPVYNAVATLRECVESALLQVGLDEEDVRRFRVYVCCYDDGSSDHSWKLLNQLLKEHAARQQDASAALENATGQPYLRTTLLIGKAEDGISRGAGYARNRAVHLRNVEDTDSASRQASTRLLAMLDSDDVMMPTRLVTQARFWCSLPDSQIRNSTLIGCQFKRDPPESTWHYTQWANSLTDERLSLEKFREVTLLQPTWMMSRSWFTRLGGYLEAPAPDQTNFSMDDFATALLGQHDDSKNLLELVDESNDTAQTLRVAEDTRFFYKHLSAGGSLRLLRANEPLLMYRHREGQSQSSQTPRKLLFSLRVRAFEQMVLEKESSSWSKFCIWGAGRDGKDFIKALRPEFRKRVFCMVDVDEKKISAGYYCHKKWGLRVPIVHFSMLARDDSVRDQLRTSFESGADMHEPGFGRIRKGRDSAQEEREKERPRKRRKASHVELDKNVLPTLPVVVCVAMYRTGGALEHNVQSIGRTEGVDLWHFS